MGMWDCEGQQASGPRGREGSWVAPKPHPLVAGITSKCEKEAARLLAAKESGPKTTGMKVSYFTDIL